MPPERLGGYLRDFARLPDRYGYDCPPLRPLRRGLRALPDRLRPPHGGRRRAYRRFIEEAADLVVGYGGSLSGEHGDGQSRARAAPEDVRPRARRCVPRVQVHLGPARTHEPRQGRGPAAAGPRTCGWGPTTPRTAETVSVPEPTTAAWPRRPSAASAWASAGGRRRRDVPELHGDARREALDPRPRAPAVRDDAAAIGQRGWRDRGRPRRARSVPVVQGLQERLPGQRRHGDVQGGVPVATTTGSLRPRAAYARGPIHRWARSRHRSPPCVATR